MATRGLEFADEAAQDGAVLGVGEGVGHLGDEVVGRVAGVVPAALDDLPVHRPVAGVGVDRVGQVDLALAVLVPAAGLLAQFVDDARGDDVAADGRVRGRRVTGFGFSTRPVMRSRPSSRSSLTIGTP